MFGAMAEAIARERALKRWHRERELDLIERTSPHRSDPAVSLGLALLAKALRFGGC